MQDFSILFNFLLKKIMSQERKGTKERAQKNPDKEQKSASIGKIENILQKTYFLIKTND